VKPLIASYYLPQFHEIPENNEWWGAGFTEWTNVKKAKPLFAGHKQPCYPKDRFFYDLLDQRTMEWQSHLASEHGVDAFCIYHYWFNGKQLLEKPAQNYLKWNNICTKYYFMWANHDWTRSWTGGNELLIKQTYGGVSDMLAHIRYLIPFFEDDRYVKIDNRPVIEIYEPMKIENREMLLAEWHKACEEAGFAGIHIIAHLEAHEPASAKEFNSWTAEEHTASLSEIVRTQPYLVSKASGMYHRTVNRLTGKPRIFDYADIVDISVQLSTKHMSDPRFLPQVCTGWDNTPRYGSRGYIVQGCSAGAFENFLSQVYSQAVQHKKPIVIIPCWNEWCEGMVLEPTESDGPALLRSIKSVIGAYNLTKTQK